jgi:hypothetical protein
MSSGFGGAPGGYEDSELERFQEEIRRRQALGSAVAGGPQAAAFSALARARPLEYGHLGMLGADASSPYYARQAAAAASTTPYARIATNPYLALSDPQARAAYAGSDPAGGSLSQIYASHQQQLVAAAYGGARPAASPTEQPYAAPSYGLPPTPATTSPAAVTATAAAVPSSAAAYKPVAPKSSSSSSAKDKLKISPQTASEIAIMQEAFNRERKNSMKRSGIYTNPRTPLPGGGKPAFTSRALRLPPPVKTGNGKKKDTAILGRDDLGKSIVEDRGSTWYMGSVPLGVDDDKYWLSELQVYLRANFAEAFGATEDDIAAPMHGRNKPIALGQVGIRCLHCKGKF